MQGKTLSIGLRAALAIIAVTLFVTSTWAAAQETVLHSFNHNGTDGQRPAAGLIFDAAKINLYGTTNSGGTYGYGTVFELTPQSGGGWTERVLYSFCLQANCTDGAAPYAGLKFDAAGNLYGTTTAGGTYGYGTVFELTPAMGGSWTEQVLYSFCSRTNCTDGAAPYAGLIFDAAGNLYGTTIAGGIYNTNSSCTGGCGTVFEMTPAGGGWTETVLYSFCPAMYCFDGAQPYAGLIFNAAGNLLYGTTYAGGTGGNGGTVFELTPAVGGGWTEAVLYSFCPENFCEYRFDGFNPYAGLVIDAADDLYGTT